MRHRAAVAVLVLATLILLTNCREEPPPQVVQRPLLILISTDITTFDPQIPFEVDSSYVLLNIFESLVEFDSTFRLSPGLAKRWTNPDDKTWRFYLDEKARFSDGSLLKASDVAFSIERLRTLPNSDVKGFVEHIQSTHVVNDHTIDIITDTPQNILNSVVFIPIMSEKYVREVGENVGNSPLGTGPYKLTKWEKNKKIVLSVNEYYRPQPDVQQIHFVISNEPERALDDVLRMKPDIAVTLPFRRVEEFQSRKPPDLEAISSNGISVEFLVFNLRPTIPGFENKNPLLDLNLRKAIALSMNREEIVRTIFRGYARPASQLVAPEVFGYNPSIPGPVENLAEAKRLVQEGGYSNLEIPLYTVEGGSFRLEKLLIQQWAKAGLKVTIKTWKNYTEQTAAANAGDFVMWMAGYVCTSGDAGELLTWGLHTRDEKGSLGKGNYGNYSNAEIDRLSEENLRVLDPRSRLDMLQRAMQIVNEELPYVPLLIYDDVYIVSKRIRWAPPVSGEIRVKSISYRVPAVTASKQHNSPKG